MTDWSKLADIRREYGTSNLNETELQACPIKQFKQWFEEVLAVEKNDPSAMVLATVDEKNYPDTRVVLLKGLEEENFIFYTNYLSNKAKQLDINPHAALNFYWPLMVRQVRLRGKVEQLSPEQSDAYFASRPRSSQIGAIVSPQSQVIPDRQNLENAYLDIVANSPSQLLERPSHWGGYRFIPHEIEFWQGRDNRLHDRIFYYKQGRQWVHCRLAP